jgi:hypothetical protein
MMRAASRVQDLDLQCTTALAATALAALLFVCIAPEVHDWDSTSLQLVLSGKRGGVGEPHAEPVLEKVAGYVGYIQQPCFS